MPRTWPCLRRCRWRGKRCRRRFPDVTLSLDAVYRDIDPAAIVAQLTQNEAEHGTASMPLLSWFRVPAPLGMADNIADAILDLPFVDLSYADAELPLAVSNPADEPLAAGQTWQAPAPVGVMPDLRQLEAKVTLG